MAMKKPIIFFIFAIISVTLHAQSDRQIVSGQVSFLSSRNTYVRFANTQGISVNDTLYISSGDKLVPAFVVVSLSSTSCLCTAISGESVPVGHLVVARKRPVSTMQPKTLEDIKRETPAQVTKKDSLSTSPPGTGTLQKGSDTKGGRKVSGSLGISSYSDISNTAKADLQRFRYNLSLNTAKTGNRGISAETYLSFRHKKGEWDQVKKDVFNALKVYSLSITYHFDSTMHIKAGRQINQRLASAGPFDGLVFEKAVGRFTTGLTAGARPDFINFGFNPDLLQYGGYISFDYVKGHTYSGTSLAYMEQMNSGKTDRRFLYFQHSGTLTKNLSLFTSFDLDLLRVKNGTGTTGLDLTSLYASLNYRFSNRLYLSGSYDTRKNPVYIETYRTLLDSITDTELRQSFRIQASLRIAGPLLFGIQSSLRYLKSDPRQAKNVAGYLSYNPTGLKKYNFSVILSGNYTETNYLDGFNAGISLMNSLAGGKVLATAGYSYQDYKLSEVSQNLIQHTGKADLYWIIIKKLSLSASYEAVFEPQSLYHRLYLQLLLRF